VFTGEIIREVFGVESKVMPDPVSGKPMCIPLRARPRGAPGLAMVAP
jgi:ABC-type cobalamin/Fe3+-siderophores transport system ATPase subunit